MPSMKGWMAARVFFSILVFIMIFYFSDLLAETAVRITNMLGLSSFPVFSWIILGILGYLIYKITAEIIIPVVLSWALS